MHAPDLEHKDAGSEILTGSWPMLGSGEVERREVMLPMQGRKGRDKSHQEAGGMSSVNRKYWSPHLSPDGSCGGIRTGKQHGI